LHRYSTGHSIYRAGKLYQQAIPGGLYYAPLMVSYGRIDDFAANRLQGRQSTDLIGTHQTAIANNVSGQDGR
jgi:hypothetical protein